MNNLAELNCTIVTLRDDIWNSMGSVVYVGLDGYLRAHASLVEYALNHAAWEDQFPNDDDRDNLLSVLYQNDQPVPAANRDRLIEDGLDAITDEQLCQLIDKGVGVFSGWTFEHRSSPLYAAPLARVTTVTVHDSEGESFSRTEERTEPASVRLLVHEIAYQTLAWFTANELVDVSEYEQLHRALIGPVPPNCSNAKLELAILIAWADMSKEQAATLIESGILERFTIEVRQGIVI